MSEPDRSAVIRLAEAYKQIPAGEHATRVLHHGTLDAALSCPTAPVQQTPHTQDEVYVIVRGRGTLCHDGEREGFEPGDLLFVAAGTEHQFEDCTDDLALWRLFYGPPGGEIA